MSKKLATLGDFNKDKDNDPKDKKKPGPNDGKAGNTYYAGTYNKKYFVQFVNFFM